MKIKYLILLAAILFIVGCAQKQVTPTETTTPTPVETTPSPVETTPTPTPVPVETLPMLSSVVIKDRIATPTELTIKAGAEVTISVEGATLHTIIVDKGTKTVANLGPLSNGKTASYIFTEAGSYTIRSLKIGTVKVAVTVE